MEIPLELSIGFLFLSFLASFAACFFSSLAGGGAGLILLPVLLFLGLPFVNALACHKIAVGFIGFGSGYRYAKEDLIDWKIFWWTSLVGLPFVVIGTVFAEYISGDEMKPVIGIIVLVMVAILGFRKKSEVQHNPRSLSLSPKDFILPSLILMPMAFYSGSISVAAGVFTTLLYLWYFKYDHLHATAMTMTANGIFWNGSGAIAHLFMGHVVWSLAPALILGALLGSYAGAGFGIARGNKFMRIAFLSSAAVTGTLLLLR